MINRLPMVTLIQTNDVAVFQTFAVADEASIVSHNSIDNHIDADIAKQQMQQVGQASYGALNLGLHVNDDATKVLDNRMRLLAAFNRQLTSESSQSKSQASVHSLHWVNQVHGDQVYDVDATTLSMAPMSADAIVSEQRGRGLAIMTADCVPIVLYQPATGKIAAIHAGWQGLACGVIKKTVERFIESGDIQAWIGVCISQASYEVGRPVLDKLYQGCTDNQSLITSDRHDFEHRYVTRSDDTAATYDDKSLHTANGQKQSDQSGQFDKSHSQQTAIAQTDKVRLNLPRLAADQLSHAGVTVDNELAIDCSYADSRYYSYRRQTHLQQPATGRMALVIVRR